MLCISNIQCHPKISIKGTLFSSPILFFFFLHHQGSRYHFLSLFFTILHTPHTRSHTHPRTSFCPLSILSVLCLCIFVYSVPFLYCLSPHKNKKSFVRVPVLCFFLVCLVCPCCPFCSGVNSFCSTVFFPFALSAASFSLSVSLSVSVCLSVSLIHTYTHIHLRFTHLNSDTIHSPSHTVLLSCTYFHGYYPIHTPTPPPLAVSCSPFVHFVSTLLRLSSFIILDSVIAPPNHAIFPLEGEYSLLFDSIYRATA